MTANDWKEAENKLRGLWGSVEFEIDGYKITVEKRMYSATKLKYVVFVNGEVRGEWWVKDEFKPLLKRFYCHHEKFFNKRAYKEKVIKIFGKKNAKKTIEEYNLDGKYEWYTESFNSFSTLKNTFIKNNKDIRLIKTNNL